MSQEQNKTKKVTDLYIDINGCEPFPVEILADYRENGGSGVIDLGVFSSEEMERLTKEGIEFYNRLLDIWNNNTAQTSVSAQPSACSCCMKKLDDGTVIMGRNMDVASTFFPAYIFRGKGNGKDRYDTVNIGYCSPGPITFDQIAETSSLPKHLLGTFITNSFDVLNSEGLFIEANGRTAKDQLATSSTNPKAETRIESLVLTRLIGDHCETIEDALDYLKTIDIYTGAVSFALAMMDKTGRYGVLEIAFNRVIWNEGTPGYACGQTNFFWDKQARALSRWNCGYGRWDKIIDKFNYIRNKDDLKNVMDYIRYDDYLTNGTAAKDWKCDFITEFMVQEEYCIRDNWLKGILQWRDEFGIEVDEEELARVKTFSDKQVRENTMWDDDYVLTPEGRYEITTVQDLFSKCFHQLPVEAKKMTGMMEITSIGYVCDNKNRQYDLHFFEMDDVYHITVDKTVIERFPCKKILGEK